MSDLDIEIKVAVGNALAELTRTEAAARAAEKAGDNLVSTFKRLGETIQREQRELQQARTATDNLKGSFAGLARGIQADQLNATAKAFAGLTQQLQREADMLERMHGPARRQAEDMQTLEMLYKRGAISAAEYTEQLEKMGAVHGPSKSGAGGGALDSIKGAGGEAIGAIGGQIAGIAGPAAIATGAVAALGHELEMFKQRGIDVDMAANSILKFHASMAGAQAAMGEQRQLSDDLGMNIQKTAHAYAAVREATEGFGISSKEATDITRNMTAAIVVDGGAIENVTGIMDRLQFASESGMLTQRELKAVWKESPEVVHMFEAALGKTYPQLQKMAVEGKLTGKTLETMVHGTAQGTEAMDKYRQRILEVGDVMEENHGNYAKAIEIMVKMHEQYEELADTGPEAFERSAAAASHQVVVLTELADKLQLIMTAAAVQGGFARDKSLIDSGLKVQQVLNSQKSEWAQYQIQLADFKKTAMEAGMSAEQAAKAAASIHPPGWVDYYKQELEQILGPQKAFNGGVNALNQLLAAGRINTKQYTDELARLTETYHQFDAAAVRGAMFKSRYGDRQSESFSEDEFAGYTGTFDSTNHLSSNKDMNGQLSEGAAAFSSFQKGFHDQILKNAEAEKKQIDEITGHLQPLEDAWVELAMTGTTSWSKMIDSMLADLARLAAHELLRGIVRAAIGSTWTDQAASIASGGSHAFGGSYVAPNTGGGQDSITVVSRVSPGERIDYTPQGKAPQAGSAVAQSPAPIVQIVDARDPRALMESPEFDRAVHRVILKNPSIVRSVQRG